MDKSYYQQYEPIFGSWHIKDLIGEGSFGQVYEIERNEMGITYKAALKAITIPQSQNEIRSIMADGMTKAEVTTYYKGIVQDLISEIVLMSKLKGNSNIVSYEDHILKEHEDHVGWDILIRMELLTPLYDYVLQNKMTKREIIKLGIDICKALELCQKYNIIHRDVKPENIFVSDAGDFKLGDFGIARMVEKTNSGLSKKGTYTYMAPEIYRGDQYGTTVDLYSLGIVMYRLLNNNRTPFLPPYPQPITHNDKEGALLKRISGKELPVPANATGRLAEIVLKACAFDPEQRYTSAMQMRMELEAILYDKDEAELVYPDGETSSMGSMCYATETATATAMVLDEMNEPTASILTDVETDKTESLFGTVILDTDIETEDKTESIFDATILQMSDEPEDKTESLLGTLPDTKNLDAEYVHEDTETEDIVDSVSSDADYTELEEPESFEVSELPEEVELSPEPSVMVSEKLEIDAKSEEKNSALEQKIDALPSRKNRDVKKNEAEPGSPMKKIIPIVIVVIVLLIAGVMMLTSKNVSDIEGFDKSVTLSHGESVVFEPKAVAKDGQEYEVAYTIEDEKIAVVKDGKLHGKAEGTTKMTLTADDYTEEVEIVVEKAKVTKIKNISGEITLYEGDSYRLEPVIVPEEAADVEITYSSNKEGVATVSSKGKIVAKSEGTATIVIIAGDIEEKIKVTVIEEPVYEEPSYEEPEPEPTPEPESEPEPEPEPEPIDVEEIETEDEIVVEEFESIEG